MTEYTYDLILDIEGHVERMRDDFHDIFNMILTAEKKILSAGNANPYPSDYHFAEEGTRYFYEDKLDYFAGLTELCLDQTYDYSDGDYACMISRRITYDVINGGPEAIEAFVIAQYNTRLELNKAIEAQKERDTQRQNDEETQKRFDQYLMLKAEFENV